MCIIGPYVHALHVGRELVGGDDAEPVGVSVLQVDPQGDGTALFTGPWLEDTGVHGTQIRPFLVRLEQPQALVDLHIKHFKGFSSLLSLFCDELGVEPN